MKSSLRVVVFDVPATLRFPAQASYRIRRGCSIGFPAGARLATRRFESTPRDWLGLSGPRLVLEVR